MRHRIPIKVLDREDYESEYITLDHVILLDAICSKDACEEYLRVNNLVLINGKSYRVSYTNV